MAKHARLRRHDDLLYSRDKMISAARDLTIMPDDDLAFFYSDQSPQSQPDPKISDRELISLYALLAYAAHNQDVRQDTVQMIVEAHFGLKHLKNLPRKDYFRAVEFIVDINLTEILN